MSVAIEVAGAPAQLESLSGLRKAAIFLVSLGADASAQVFKLLDEAEIEVLSAEISRLRDVSGNVTAAVLKEFTQMALAQEYITKGGINYAMEVLDKALGRQRALEIISRLQANLQPAPFAVMKKADPKHLLDFIRREHPQTIALILANLESDSASVILSELPPENQIDVVLRLANMDKTSPEVLKQIEQVLEKRVSAVFAQEVSSMGGVKAVAEILNRVDRNTEKKIFQTLEEIEPELAEQIKRLMFTFEDLILVDDRGIQRVLKEVDQRDLALALKAAGEDVSGKVYKNMSERAAAIIRQEIEYLGPVRLRDIEDAQLRIVSITRRLEETGEIIIAGRGGSDEIVV
jgi:flagellar motor switch protein FliG